MRNEEKQAPEEIIASAMVEITDLTREASKKIREQGSGIREVIELIMQVYRNNKRLFVMGKGRSGLVGEAFAMRARHLDFHAHVIGESTTPAVRPDDLVIVISGSGKTRTNITLCETIKKEIGTKIIAITSHLDSPLAKLADISLEVPGRENAEAVEDYDKRRLIGEPPLVPLGTLFETNALIFLDSLIGELMMLTGTTEEDMKERHAIE
jgi:6-phospho-3-hexuloisomerase